MKKTFTITNVNGWFDFTVTCKDCLAVSKFRNFFMERKKKEIVFELDCHRCFKVMKVIIKEEK